MVIQIARRLQCLHDAVERDFLVRVGVQDHLPGLLQQRVDVAALVHLQRQGQGIGEQADHAFQFGSLPVGHRRADHHRRLAAEPRQQHRERAVEEHEQGHAVRGSQGFEALGQRRIQHQIVTGAAVAARGRTRTIERQLQQGWRGDQTLRPGLRQRIALRRLQPALLPACVVGILDRQRRQGRLGALAEGRVQRFQLTCEQQQRPAVGDDVVELEQQRVCVRPEQEQAHTQQRPLGEIEVRIDFLRGDAGERGLTLGGGERAQVVDRQGDVDVGRRQHRGHRLAVERAEHGAQRFVAVAQGVHGAMQGGRIDRIAQGQ
ncbi:hypothetical protein LMG19144_02556 [Xanthomonas arboricola pv. fragariae]|nr:hypothetical protein LMG19144_02556 [Xanthomonas arboricola pv. fragariae]